MEQTNKSKMMYRVERWVKPVTGDGEQIIPWKYREHFFSSQDDVDKYVETHKKTYLLKIFFVKEQLLEEVDEVV